MTSIWQCHAVAWQTLNREVITLGKRPVSDEAFRRLNADVPSDRVCCDFVQCPSRPNVFCKALDDIAPQPSHEGSTFRMAYCKRAWMRCWKGSGSIGFHVGA